MPFAYKLHTEALKEYVHAYEWYENKQKGLGEKFIDVIDERVAQICNNTEHYSRIHRSYRRASIEGFPYSIVYEFFPREKFVHISSIYHNSRNPRKKFRKEEP